MDSEYDRKSELIAFDDSKAGVKGLVDAGVAKIPHLEGVNSDAILRAKIIDKVRNACEIWGIFQIVNHGILKSVLEEMIKGIRRFNEQDTEVKKEFYTRDSSKKVKFVSNSDLFQAPAATWKDSFSCIITPNPPDPTDMPAVCRDIIMEYSKQVKMLANTLFELVAEALGLNSNHLKDMECAEGLFLVSHYYPACPEPELTMGTKTHTDPTFLTVLLQDQVGGLQVLHEKQWVNVNPVPGALVINTGDLLQLVSNDMFRSAKHRVLANHKGQEYQWAAFFLHLVCHPQNSTDQSRSCYQKRILQSTRKPQQETMVPATEQKGMMVLLLSIISSFSLAMEMMKG
ncbi:1-aminocyclopropane-1-carboxylate oxidase-like 1 [Vitis vinifera]|uniref:1-aminocyclopropane-1-carboxylate oxidase-like 1 n=1 Tax=Vitis vinifera TaxID=29760 RepID=A0A438C4T1_VITVI|nr:1-aminocyclopropane-1-carboxylate oxidase-like 1 [Vitis vinifera]